ASHGYRRDFYRRGNGVAIRERANGAVSARYNDRAGRRAVCYSRCARNHFQRNGNFVCAGRGRTDLVGIELMDTAARRRQEIYQPQFDTIYLPSQLAGNRCMGFVYPQGHEVSIKYGTHVKTEKDTNILQASVLCAPQSFVVEGIECYFVDDEGIISAKSRWYAESSIAFIINAKMFYQSPIAKCAAMAAIWNLEKEVLLSKEQIDSLRVESKLQKPIEIRQQEYFKVEATFSDWCMSRWENRTAPSKLCVYLNGLLRIPEY